MKRFRVRPFAISQRPLVSGCAAQTEALQLSVSGFSAAANVAFLPRWWSDAKLHLLWWRRCVQVRGVPSLLSFHLPWKNR